MTTSAPIPAPDTVPSMARRSDTASEAPPAQPQARVRAAAAVRPSLRAQVAENPLLSFFGLMIVALLAAAVASPNIRINDTNRRIDRLEDRLIEFEEKVDARFDALEAAVTEIDRKLTALIAHLNATSAVDDALAGRLTGDSTPDAAVMSDDVAFMSHGWFRGLAATGP